MIRKKNIMTKISDQLLMDGVMHSLLGIDFDAYMLYDYIENLLGIKLSEEDECDIQDRISELLYEGDTVRLTVKGD